MEYVVRLVRFKGQGSVVHVGLLTQLDRARFGPRVAEDAGPSDWDDGLKPTRRQLRIEEFEEGVEGHGKDDVGRGSPGRTPKAARCTCGFPAP